jgi:cyclophilin family peptidyl-prolyl cis-trans isomerase
MTENAPNTPSSGSPRGLLYGIAAIVLIGILSSAYFLVLKKGETSPDAPAAQTETGTETPPSGESAPAANGSVDLSVDASGLSKSAVVIETEKGTIKFRFYSEDAPNTTARIAELVQSGFYDGLIFHRVVPGFVIQGGDPTGTGTSGSGQKQKLEINPRKHTLGAVAMARAQDPDSADSQFYITLDTIPHLDGSYTVFGQVVEGMDIVQSIVVGDKMTRVRFE